MIMPTRSFKRARSKVRSASSRFHGGTGSHFILLRLDDETSEDKSLVLLTELRGRALLSKFA